MAKRLSVVMTANLWSMHTCIPLNSKSHAPLFMLRTELQ